MERDWRDFKCLHSNIEGARSAFEKVCEDLFRKIYTDNSVTQIEARQGDGGIDILIGEIGIEPITIIQCKFFLEEFNESQKSQIRKSFNTAINSKEYELKKWILCIPYVFDIKQAGWFSNWKNKMLLQHNKKKEFINIKNGNELISLLKHKELYNKTFNIEEALKIDEIYKTLVREKPVIKNNPQKNPKLILFNNYKEDCKEFYLSREIDYTFNSSLELNNIWLYGESGYGKTTLISKNLIDSKIESVFCDLSPIRINSSNDIFREITEQLELKFEVEIEREGNMIKNITNFINTIKIDNLIILLDEFYITNSSLLEEIANDLIKFVNYYNNISLNNCNIKFVISTIKNPCNVFHNKSKASNFFLFLNCNKNWENDIKKLYDIINSNLYLDIENYENKIIEKSNNSPRILKNIFRKIVSREFINDEIIENIFEEIKNECY